MGGKKRWCHWKIASGERAKDTLPILVERLDNAWDSSIPEQSTTNTCNDFFSVGNEMIL